MIRNLKKYLLPVCAVLFPALAWGEADLFISRHPAKVLPKAMAVIPAESAGELEVCHFGGRGVAAGTLLARLNPEALALEEAEFRQQVERNNLEAEGNILKLRRELEELDFIAGLDARQRPFVEQRAKVKADARARDLLERKIAAIGEQTRIANGKLSLAYERTLAFRELRMPYDGVVQYHIPLPEKEGMRVPVASAAPILTVADDSTLYIAVALADPELAKLHAERFSVSLVQGDSRIRACYAFRRIEKQGQSEQPVYYFAVPPENREAAWALVGANIVAGLHYRGDGGWRYESKYELAREAGERSFSTWAELVAELRPNHTLVFCGETHLCLKPAAAGSGKASEPPQQLPATP